MKNIKSALIAVLFALTAANAANGLTIREPGHTIINLTLMEAIQNPQLVAAMYQQIDPGFLNNYQPWYVKSVVIGNHIFRIKGPHDQWVAFFKHIPRRTPIRTY